MRMIDAHIHLERYSDEEICLLMENTFLSDKVKVFTWK